MSAQGIGGLIHSTRARLFPLPYYSEPATAWRSPNRSARICRRRKLTQLVTLVTNRCIFTLNRMYSTAATPPPRPAPVRTSSHSPTTRKQGNPPLTPAPGAHLGPSPRALPPSSRRSHAAVQDLARDFPASASRQQQRLASHLRSRCASFVLAARCSSIHTTEVPSVGTTDDEFAMDVFTSYSFTDQTSDRGSPDQLAHGTGLAIHPCDIEGPLPSHSTSSAAAASSLLPPPPSLRRRRRSCLSSHIVSRSLTRFTSCP